MPGAKAGREPSGAIVPPDAMSTPALTGVVAARPTPKHQGATVPIAQPIRERLILKPAQKRGATATQEHELCCKPEKRLAATHAFFIVDYACGRVTMA
jgi:hypothetical protein